MGSFKYYLWGVHITIFVGNLFPLIIEFPPIIIMKPILIYQHFECL